jgi:hypothetical protein
MVAGKSVRKCEVLQAMIKRFAAITSLFVAMLTPGIAAQSSQPHHRHHHHHRKKIQSVNYRKLAEAKGYKKVSSLVNFPEFFPGLGVI